MQTTKIKSTGVVLMQGAFSFIFFLLLFPVNQRQAVRENNIPVTAKPALEVNAPKPKSEVEKRLLNMEMSVEPRYTPTVKKLINDYLVYGKKGTERIIGRSTIFFPTINQFLKEQDLPLDLKYLAVVESKLKIDASSPAGALGLWQFISSTGELYGLEINDTVDQRLDVEAASKAALAYLKELHAMFGDWGLAMAAYNCGPNRVKKAIEESGIDITPNFWDVKPFLPKETQGYVQSFIAVQYVMKNYLLHNIRPKYPASAMAQFETIQVLRETSFEEIAAEYGISSTLIASLNPCYSTGVVPFSERGYAVVVPKEAFLAYEAIDNVASEGSL